MDAVPGDHVDTTRLREYAAAWSGLSAAVAAVTAVVGLTAAVAPSSSLFAAPILLLVPGILTVAAWRFSMLVTVVLAQTTVHFGFTWLLLREPRTTELVSAVVLWSCALLLGAIMVNPSGERRVLATWAAPRWSHFLIAGLLVVMQLVLIEVGKLGYRAQIETGLSAPAGPLGMLATVAPALTIMVLASALAADASSERISRRSWLALALATAQAMVLALSGFRGAAAVFLVAAVVTVALLVPPGSLWRRPVVVAVPAAVLVVSAAGLFVLGGAARVDAVQTATSLPGIASPSTNQAAVDAVVAKVKATNESGSVVRRLDLAQPLQAAIDRRDEPAARAAVAWSAQVGAFIPRVVWPSKPVYDYGTQVSIAVYGMSSGQSSSTVTTLGDGLLNGGEAALAFMALAVGAGLCAIERRVRRRSGVMTLALAAAAAVAVVGLEGSIVLETATALRTVLVTGVLWWLLLLIARRFTPAVPTRVAGSSPEGRAQVRH